MQLDFSTAFGWLTSALQIFLLAALMSFDKIRCLKAYATTVCPISEFLLVVGANVLSHLLNKLIDKIFDNDNKNDSR